MKNFLLACAVTATVMTPLAASAEVTQLNVPLGAGGFGFLPLHMMREFNLVEKHAEEAGIELTVNWANVGGPAAMNDALLSGSAHFISAGPPAFITLWDRTQGNMEVMGAAAMSSMPMSLNTRAEHLKSVDDLKPADKIAVTSVKSSIPSIIMQMHAVKKYGKDQAFRFDPYTVTMNHADAAVALISGSSNIAAHYASPPLSQRELKQKGIRSIMSSDDVMGGSTTFTMVSTTQKFHDENPKVYAAFVAALKEAQAMIKADKRAAAEVLIESMGGGDSWSIEDMVAILDDPAIKYTTKPENVMKYAEFMNDIGSIKRRPKSITELFFDEADIATGN